MKTLLLRLEGPMQSWGTSSRFTERDTRLEPTKSGVIGLLCAAMGKPRLEDTGDDWPRLSCLVSLRMGVRVDRPGQVGVDFQTAGGGNLGHRKYGVIRAESKKEKPELETVTSWRYYLQDASFLVGLESEDVDLLRRLYSALKEPVWPLYLGRKAYVPGTPVYLPDGLQDGDLIAVLGRYPPAGHKRVILDDPTGSSGEVREDLPLDFERRRFGIRHVRVEFIEVPSSF